MLMKMKLKKNWRNLKFLIIFMKIVKAKDFK